MIRTSPVARAGSRRGADILWLVLFLIIFVNGFESGGYQASLWSIGQTYDLSATSMGVFAAVELFADMLAPILLGSWADRLGKGKSIAIMLACQVVAACVTWVSTAQPLFVAGMFLLGLTTSALQFIAIALLADAYPASGNRKIGYITSMYAFGALTSPLVVSYYLGAGLSWRTLFVLLSLGSVLALAGILRAGTDAREKTNQRQRSHNEGGTFVLPAILLLCVVMCVYVGFENGFAFFVDTLFTDVFKSTTGKFALSLYWAVMIPSRVLVGYFSEHARKILLGCLLAIPLTTVLIACSTNSSVVLALCVPLGLASGAIYPCALTMMLPFAGRRTATATGMITAATGIGGFSFTALTGFLTDLWGMRVAMLVLAAAFAVSIVAVFALSRVRAPRRA